MRGDAMCVQLCMHIHMCSFSLQVSLLVTELQKNQQELSVDNCTELHLVII